MLIQCWVAIFCFGIWWAKLEYLNDLIKWYCVSMWIMQLSNEAHDIRYNAMNWMSFLIFFFFCFSLSNAIESTMIRRGTWFTIPNSAQSPWNFMKKLKIYKNQNHKMKLFLWSHYADSLRSNFVRMKLQKLCAKSKTKNNERWT